MCTHLAKLINTVSTSACIFYKPDCSIPSPKSPTKDILFIFSHRYIDFVCRHLIGIWQQCNLFFYFRLLIVVVHLHCLLICGLYKSTKVELSTKMIRTKLFSFSFSIILIETLVHLYSLCYGQMERERIEWDDGDVED